MRCRISSQGEWGCRPWIAALLAALALAATQAAPAGAGPHPHTREGWLVGFGVGAGSADGRDGLGSAGREEGYAASFRAGYAFSSRISLELDGTAWGRERLGTWVGYTVTGVGFNLYPGAGGLVLRAGAGSATGRTAVRDGNTTVTTTDEGAGLFAGVGYEFRVTPRFALGPQVEFGWFDVDRFTADWVNAEVGFQWYFIPR